MTEGAGTITIATERISDQLLNEAALLYAGEPHKISIWRWQFRERFGQAALAITARCDGRLVGFNGTMPVRLWAAGEETPCECPRDDRDARRTVPAVAAMTLPPVLRGARGAICTGLRRLRQGSPRALSGACDGAPQAWVEGGREPRCERAARSADGESRRWRSR
jgi:hypothetical protein